jgi:ferredoxin-NADP reductase
MPGLEIVPVLSEPGPGWAGETGLVTDAVDRRLPRLSGYDAYLCGPPAMIDAAAELVTRRGVRPATSSSTRSCRRADWSARADTTAPFGKKRFFIHRTERGSSDPGQESARPDVIGVLVDHAVHDHRQDGWEKVSGFSARCVSN